MNRVSTIVGGLVGGATAFVLSLVVIVVTAGVAVTRLPQMNSLGGSVPEWKATLWVFFDAHFVGTRTVEVFGPDGSLWSGGKLVDTVGLLEIEYLFAVPVLVLAIVGGFTAYWLGCSEGRQGMMTGMTLVVGYLPLVLLGLLVSVHFGTGPSPLRAIFIAGIVYPVLFGAVGGFLAGHFSRLSPSAESPTATDGQPKAGK